MAKYKISAAQYTRDVIEDPAAFRTSPEGEEVARILVEIRKRLTEDQTHFLMMLGHCPVFGHARTAALGACA